MKGTVRKYISFSTPQMGISNLQKFNCGFFCVLSQKNLKNLNYKEILQNNVGPSGYYKNTYDIDTYLNNNQFLKDLNNENGEKNPEYKERMLKLEKILLIVNENDELVDPITSGWFDYYEPNSKKLIYKKDSEFYLKDYIGIRELDEKDVISYSMFEGKHIDFQAYEIYDYLLPNLR